MSDLVLSNITSGYNLSLINSNFQAIQDKINNFCLQTSQGDNVMSQDLDMNSYSILNMVTNFSNNGSMLTVGDAKSHFYQIGLVPTASNNGDAVNYAQVSQMVAAGTSGISPSNVALYSDLASTAAGKGASLIYDAAKASELASASAGKGASLVQYDADETVKQRLDNIAAEAGALLVGFKQSGVGTYAQTVKDKLYYMLDLMDFVDPANRANALTGVFDLSPALSAAIDEAMARGAWGVRLPAGTLRLNTLVSKTISGINGFCLQGAGMGLTKFVVYDPSGNGIRITGAASGNWWMDVAPSYSLKFAGFTLCSTLNNLGVGLQVSNGALSGRPAAPCVFEDVETRQLNSINGQAFANGIYLLDTADTQFSNCRFFAGGVSNSVSIAVKISASAAGIDPTEHHFINCKWYYGAVAVQAGNYIEGVFFSNCTVVGMSNAVSWLTTTGESGLFWTGGHINTSSYAFNLGNLFDIQIGTALIYAKSAININVGSNIVITGNTFYGDNTGNAINLVGVTGGSRGTLIAANQFSSYAAGIIVDSTSHNVTIGTNGYASVTTRVSNASTDSYIEPRVFTGSTVKTLVGGAVFENVDIAVPSGIFAIKPANANVQVIDPTGLDIIGFYAYGDANSTATNARIRLVKRDGTNLPAGAYRFGFTITGN